MAKILILGNYKQTLIVLRSLANAGLEAVIGMHQPKSYTTYSRYVSEVWAHPKFENRTDFIDSLVNLFSTRRDICMVFPVGEEPLEAIARNFELVAPAATIVMPHPHTALACLDKQQMYGIASGLSIPLPQSRRVRSVAQLTSAAEELGFPCIVKPNESGKFFFDQKAIICRSSADVRARFENWPEGNEFLILQQYIEGPRINCQFAAQRGRITAYFEQKVLRTDRFDGTGYGVDSLSVLPTKELMDHCQKLVGKVGYSGVGCIQFLAPRNSSRFFFLEINPRLDATCALPYHCGMDFPKMAIDIAMDQREAPHDGSVKADYRSGQRVSWLWGDLQGLFHGLQSRRINVREAIRWFGNVLTAFATADVHMTFAWKDPVPTMSLYLQTLASLCHRTKS